MNDENRWSLPIGVSEALPAEAIRLEQLSRRLLDLYAQWGYELVITPFIEYLDSLLIGMGHDLELQTFRLTDQLTGRLMGIRADMTPQVARIDAHTLKRTLPTRLCYLGTVLRARPDDIVKTRAILQIGAELYGHAGIASDAEILTLMLRTLRAAGIQDFHIDVGHVNIYRGLIADCDLTENNHERLFSAVQRKSQPDIQLLQTEKIISAKVADDLMQLIEFNGDISVLDEAKQYLHAASPLVRQALADLTELTQYLAEETLHFDLAELRGYAYHTGIVFAAYVPNCGQSIAQGGRYDGIGKVFGHDRPATGFSADVRLLTSLTPAPPPTHQAIFAPASRDKTLLAFIQTLRAQGETVIHELPDQTGTAAEMGCGRVVCWKDEQWQVIPSSLP